MSDQQVQALKSLEIQDVKIYETKGDKPTVLAKGNLEVLYLPEFNRFVLRVNSFKYILSTHLSVLASLTEEGTFRSYVLPNVGGHFILKLKTAPTAIVLRNLETIFAHYSQFSYQQNHEHDLENQAHRRGDYSQTFEGDYILKDTKACDQSETAAKASNYIKIGGDILKQNILKAANYVGKNLSHPKDTTQMSQGPNQLAVKTIEELKSVQHNCSVQVPRYEVIALITLVKEVEKIIQSHAEQDIGVKLHPSGDKWPAFKKNAIESAHSLLKGMDEALGTFSKSMKVKRLNPKLPKDKMDLAFQKIDQNIKNEAPLPIFQDAPNQQQEDPKPQQKKGFYSKAQDQLKAVRGSDVLGHANIMKNLGAIKQKIIGFRGETKTRAKENHAA